MFGLSFGNASSHDTDADLRNQLDRDPGLGVGTLEVVNELSQVLDGVDVVMRRGRNQADARNGVASLSDLLGDLVTREFTSLARFGTLGHFNL